MPTHAKTFIRELIVDQIKKETCSINEINFWEKVTTFTNTTAHLTEKQQEVLVEQVKEVLYKEILDKLTDYLIILDYKSYLDLILSTATYINSCDA